MVSTNLDNLNNIPHIENTFPKLLLKHAKDRASHPAFRQKRLGIWQTLSWQQTKDTTESLSLGLSNLGLKRADKIAVIGQNTTMMYLSMLATQSLGGVIVPIFPDASAEEFQSLLAHAEIKAVICQDQEQIDKIEIVKKNIKSLEFLIYEQPRGMRSYNQNYIHSIDELIQAGGSVKGNGKSYFENEIMSGDGDDLSTIIYTPGTTANPKGVMLSYNSLISAGLSAAKHEKIDADENVLAYLPMAWIGDHLTSYAQHNTLGFTVNCPESPDTLLADLKDISPSYFLAPPRILEQVHAEIESRISGANELKKSLYRSFMELANRFVEPAISSNPVSLLDRLAYFIGKIIIYGPIKNTLGFNKIKIAYNAGDPINTKIFNFYRALGINLKPLYLQAESSGYVCLHSDNNVSSDSVGHPASDVELRINDKDEIEYRTAGIFSGYFKDKKTTNSVLSEDGWFRSGDTGEFLDNGSLKLIGRVDEVGITTTGIKVYPQYIENQLRFCTFIRNAVIYGVGKPFVSALITVDSEKLSGYLEQTDVDIPADEELTQQDLVGKLFEDEIDSINADFSSNPDNPEFKIEKFIILGGQFSSATGEFTQMGKLRRGFINEKYKELVDAIYTGQEKVDAKTAAKFGLKTAIKVRKL